METSRIKENKHDPSDILYLYFDHFKHHDTELGKYCDFKPISGRVYRAIKFNWLGKHFYKVVLNDEKNNYSGLIIEELCDDNESYTCEAEIINKENLMEFELDLNPEDVENILKWEESGNQDLFDMGIEEEVKEVPENEVKEAPENEELITVMSSENGVSEKIETNTGSKEGDKALRYNSGKPDYTLIDYESLEPMVKVLEFGAKKYSRNNWRKGLDKTNILASLQRHLGELIDDVNNGGSEMDRESKEHLIGHVLCNAMFYAYHHVIGRNKPK